MFGSLVGRIGLGELVMLEVLMWISMDLCLNAFFVVFGCEIDDGIWLGIRFGGWRVAGFIMVVVLLVWEGVLLSFGGLSFVRVICFRFAGICS